MPLNRIPRSSSDKCSLIAHDEGRVGVRGLEGGYTHLQAKEGEGGFKQLQGEEGQVGKERGREGHSLLPGGEVVGGEGRGGR